MSQQINITTKEGAWFFPCREENGFHWLNLYSVRTATFWGNTPANAQLQLTFNDGSRIVLGGQTAINCQAEFALIRTKAMKRAIG